MQHPIWALVKVLAIPLSTQLPASSPAKAVKYDQMLVLLHHRGDPEKLLTSNFEPAQLWLLWPFFFFLPSV